MNSSPLAERSTLTKPDHFQSFFFFLILNLEISEIWDTTPQLHGLLIAHLKLGPQTASSSISWE